MDHPNSKTDPDCTSQQALEEALQIRIAAELHHRMVQFLNEEPEYDEYSPPALLELIKGWRVEIETKYEKLRALIGLTGGTKNAT